MFGIADYGAFCGAVVIFLALPGPGTFALLSATGKGGLRAGAAATCGVIAGDQVLLWCAVAGVAAVLAANPLALRSLQYLGAAYLTWVGLRLVLRSSGKAAPFALKTSHYARQAFLITLTNPKAIFFYMAFFPLFIDASQAGVATFAAMAATIACITAIYGLTLCALAHRVAAQVKAHHRMARWLERAAGVCLIGFGLRLTRS